MRGKEQVHLWRINNPERYAASNRAFYLKTKEKSLARSALWRKENKDRKRAVDKAYREANRDHVRAVKADGQRRRRQDPTVRMVVALRARIRYSLLAQTAAKGDKSMNLMGCDGAILKNHIESLFQPGMTWYNYGKGVGKWVVDHILPCSWYDLSDEGHQKRCFHYTNLQPLWDNENREKSDRPFRNLWT